MPFEILPIEGVDAGDDEMTHDDVAEILRYESRVEARSARRLERIAGLDDLDD